MRLVVHYHVWRQVVDLRWAVLPIAFAAVAWMQVDALLPSTPAELERPGATPEIRLAPWHYLNPNLWDVYFHAWSGDRILVRYLYVFLFVFLVADAALRELLSGDIWLTLTRARSRLAWFWGKCAAVAASAAVFVIAGSLVILLTGAVGTQVELGWSELSREGYSGVPVAIRSAASPLLPALGWVLHAILAYAAIGFVLLGISFFAQHVLTPLVIAFIWLFVTSHRPYHASGFDLLQFFDPVRHLLMPASSSELMVLWVIALASLVAGWLRFRRMDLSLHDEP